MAPFTPFKFDMNPDIDITCDAGETESQTLAQDNSSMAPDRIFKRVQCRFCGRMHDIRHLRRHVSTHNKKFARKKFEDLILAHGEYVIKPFWSSEKEAADPKEPETPPHDCDSEHEKCQFYYEQLLKGNSTPWVDQKFG